MVLLLASGCAAGLESDAPAEASSDERAAATEQELGVSTADASPSRTTKRCWVSHIVIKDERVPFRPQDDVDLIDALVPHHRGAIEMADAEIEQGAHPELIAMAEEMRAAQLQEIEELLTLRAELTGCKAVPRMFDQHMAADIAELRASQGEALDRLFVEHMIPHHASAVQMAHYALRNLTNTELREMATTVVEQQSMEIAEMLELKTQL